MHVATDSIVSHLPWPWTSSLPIQWQNSCTMEEWEDMAVPPNTCLLYVDTA